MLRTATLEQTWRRFAPKRARAGITRLAELTGLDTLEIPVFAAIRPMGKSLSTQQGKGVTPISLDEYRKRYVEEMKAQAEKISELAARVDRGETVTLLCSKDCIIEQSCHRSILRELIEAARSKR